MRTITPTEFKANCLQLLDEVQRSGQDLVISKRGKPVARVVAEKPSKPWLALRGTGIYMGDPFAPVLAETSIVAEMNRLPAGFHRDPADRLIVATARCLKLPLATKDRKIRSSRMVSLWKA